MEINHDVIMKKIINILEVNHQGEKLDVNEKTSLRDLGYNSLDLMDKIAEIEDSYDIRIDVTNMPTDISIKKLADIVEERCLKSSKGN